MNYIFSTATTPIAFVQYSEKQKNRYPTVLRKVIIKGGANRTLKTLETPRGIVTEVSDDDLVFLSADPKFQGFVKRGFMTIAGDKKDLDSALKGMTPKDKSAPMVAEDFKPGGRAQQGTGSFDGKGEVSAGAPSAA